MNPSLIVVEDLSPVQRRAICNGCGSKGGPFARVRPAQLCYEPACDQHDLDYWVGGSAIDKHVADDALYETSLLLLAKWNREKPRGRVGVALRRLAAWLEHQAVRFFGMWAFHYGRPRTEADLAVVGVAEVSA
jgi:hypothetical protein